MNSKFTTQSALLNRHERAAANGQPFIFLAKPTGQPVLLPLRQGNKPIGVYIDITVDFNCIGCRARLYAGTPAITKLKSGERDGEAIQVFACGQCAERTRLDGTLRPIPASAGERPWSADDRRWFTRRPGRKYRARLVHDHELANARNAPLASLGQLPDRALCGIANAGDSLVRAYIALHDDDPETIDFDTMSDADIEAVIRDGPADVQCALATVVA